MPISDLSNGSALTSYLSDGSAWHSYLNNGFVLAGLSKGCICLDMPISGMDLHRHAATLRQMRQIKIAVFTTLHTIPPGLPVLVLTLLCQLNSRAATKLPGSKSLVWHDWGLISEAATLEASTFKLGHQGCICTAATLEASIFKLGHQGCIFTAATLNANIFKLGHQGSIFTAATLNANTFKLGHQGHIFTAATLNANTFKLGHQGSSKDANF